MIEVKSCSLRRKSYNIFVESEKKLQRNGRTPLATQIEALNVSDLLSLLKEKNEQLAGLGVRVPISDFFYAANAYGHRYEDRRYARGGTIPTPVNTLMGLVHNQPDLLRLPLEEFENLVAVVAELSIVVQTMVERTSSGFDWPDAYTKPPQRSGPL